jgi:DNA invertase Pin-like site-specific DNA recombinase
VALDVAVDTTAPQGAAMAQVLAVFAELERRLIGQRTNDALAVKRSQCVRLGRPPRLPDEVVRRLV